MQEIIPYVSKELTHFVGRSLPEDEQYPLLNQIISSGWLLPPPHVIDYGSMGQLRINKRGSVSDDSMYSPDCLSFCDIPVASIELHMQKYSHFGIAFSKTFLAKKNASPVYYVARNAKTGIHGQFGVPTRAEFFDSSARSQRRLWPVLRQALKVHPELNTMENRVALGELEFFINFYVFSFVKVFDEKLPQEHSNNFYMEREWRMLGPLEFQLDDIVRIIVPEAYITRLREDFPKYRGAITAV